MRRFSVSILFTLFSLSSFGQVVYNGVIVEKSDSTSVQKKIVQWTDSLNNRNFSEDAARIREESERLGNKVKETTKEHIPAIRELVQSISDYLKR